MPTDRPPEYVPPERLDVEQIIEVLNRHNVDYVLVGGMAAVLHGSSVHTADVDALVREEHKNLEQLSGALRELGAQRSTDPDAFISRIEEFETDAGSVDVLFSVKGIGSYDEVVPSRTDVILIENEEVRILDLPTLIEAKEATFDEHDKAHLAALYLLADETGVPHRSLEAVERDHQKRDNYPWDR